MVSAPRWLEGGWSLLTELFAAAYFGGLNLALLLAMAADKHRAIRHERRISENTLLTLAILGGSVGGILGMLLFRHKTRKPAFALGYPLILLAQLGIIGLVLLRTG